MAIRKGKQKRPAKLKSGKSTGIISTGIGIAKSLIGGKSGKGGKRRHKKSAMFYAREIQRLKLKKRYDKIKLGVM